MGRGEPLTAAERKAALAEWNKKGKRRIEFQGDFQVVIVRGQPVNHILHLLMTLVTVGLWGLVWLVLATGGGEKRARMQVDEWGIISITQL